MLKHFFLSLCLFFSPIFMLFLPTSLKAADPQSPNIVFILADDLGIGDVHCMNPERCRIVTPNLDRIAQDGCRFTDAHSPSAVCTPTRYSVMTGRYNWRSRLQNGVLFGFSGPLIAPERETVASMLQKEGYQTACIGKWHLGLGWQIKEGREFTWSPSPYVKGEREVTQETVDYTKSLTDSPNEHGFDYFFGISGSLDMFPFVFIRNHELTEIPTVKKKFVRLGDAGESFEAVDVLPAITDEACAFIRKSVQEQQKSGRPFFLYFPLSAPHAPIVPAQDWQGKSGLGDYGDFVMQVDDSVGKVLQTLQECGVEKNTLVIFTSDNGCSPVAKVQELERQGHFPSAGYRGYKADIFEGGHRVPFLVRWPNVVAPGTVCEQLIGLQDFMQTCAEINKIALPDSAAEDSISFLHALKDPAGQTTAPSVLRRTVQIHHSINGSFAIRQGEWKLCLCPDSGGWSFPRPNSPEFWKQNPPFSPLQLFNIQLDEAETTNVSLETGNLATVRELQELTKKIIDDGRSTPGQVQSNDTSVQMIKTFPRKKPGKSPKLQ